MKITADKLIEDYYNLIKGQYPDLTLYECTLIIKSPFKHLKKAMRQTNLPIIRWQYFGSFVVHAKRINWITPALDLLNGTSNQKKFEKYTEILKHFDSKRLESNEHDKSQS